MHDKHFCFLLLSSESIKGSCEFPIPLEILDSKTPVKHTVILSCHVFGQHGAHFVGFDAQMLLNLPSALVTA